MCNVKLKKIVYSFSVASILSFYFVSCNAQEGKVLDDMKLSITANIVAESCTALESELSDVSINLGDLQMKELRALTNISSVLKKHQKDLKLEFQCANGKWANFKVYADPSHACKSVLNNSIFTCSGKNKSVGIATNIRYTDKDGASKGPALYNNTSEARTVQLDATGKGIIYIVDAAYGVWLTRTSETVEPGEVAANYTLQVWAE